MPSIHFFYEDISIRIKHIGKLKNWIKETIKQENRVFSNINYIFCSDDFLRDINIRYLDHDTFTDIVTFDTSSDSNSQFIEGEIYISIERILDNSKKYKVEFSDELHRVMVHGVLHLVGYHDSSVRQKSIMRGKENAYLSLRKF
jgi:rRNA maturation RNase YbeY